MRALITAGGTAEPIDDVRHITNFSRGTFGAAIANALVRRGVEVTLLASRALMGRPEWVDPAVNRVGFGSFLDLQEALHEHTEDPPDLLFMAAAVSDYSPVPTQGKIRSTSDELVVRMRRNPKLLPTFRERCGQKTFLVGFKLLSGVDRATLVDVARGQLEKGRLNLTVANDLQSFGPGRHPIVLVTPEGGAVPHEGSKAEMAEVIADVVLRRAAVRWCRTEPTDDSPPSPPPPLLEWAQRSGLLTDRSGNVAVRSTEGLWTTARQVDKSTTTELAHVWPGLDDRVHRYAGPKPSIDTTVAAWLFDALPELEGIVHAHQMLAIPDATTEAAWPCGCLEEAEEIHRALIPHFDGGDILVRLVDHGWWLGVTDIDVLLARWEALVRGHDDHLADLGVTAAGRTPVFVGADMVGLWATFERGHSLWVHPDRRSRGLGDRLARHVATLPIELVAHDRCGVRDFWIARGFVPTESRDDATVLASPALHGTCREAASVCLIDPVRRRVLLGRRTAGAYLGYWSFPGGAVESGESNEAAAQRELFEETGCRVPSVPCIRCTVLTVGDGERTWRVHNFAYATLSTPAPTPSSELDARWMGFDEALQLRPMATGTRTVLRAVLDQIG